MVMIILVQSYHHLRETNAVYDQHQVKWFGPLWKTCWSWTEADWGPPMGTHTSNTSPRCLPKSKGESVSAAVKAHFYQLRNRRVRGKNQVHGVDVKHDPRLQRHTAQVASRNASYVGLVTGRNRNQEMGPWFSNMNSCIICTFLVLVGVREADQRKWITSRGRSSAHSCAIFDYRHKNHKSNPGRVCYLFNEYPIG